MRVAALLTGPRPCLDEGIGLAFSARSIALEPFIAPGALMLACDAAAFDAILIQEPCAALRGIVQDLRARVAGRTPIVVVGAGDAYAISQALLSGADDYASRREGAVGVVQRVLARVRVAAAASSQAILWAGAYRLDPIQRELASPSGQVRLTPRECRLAQRLFQTLGQVTTYEALAGLLDEEAGSTGRRSVWQHVYTLRRKFELVSTDQATALRIDTNRAQGLTLLW